MHSYFDSGNAAMCPSEKHVLIDNLSSGFDLYETYRSSPIRSFDVPTTRSFVKAGIFAEKSSILACGGEQGNVYLFRPNSSTPIQTLVHEKGL